MKLDIVYILGTGSRWQDNELRFSLRSVAKYIDHGKIFVCGEFPEWLRNVEHIPAIDGFRRPVRAWKQKNAIHKIRTACLNSKVSDDFILMNDDFFFLKKTNIETLHLGELSEAAKNHTTKDGYYYHAIVATRDLLSVAGLHTINYETHYPIVFNKKKFLSLTNSLSWHDVGYIYRSIYGNTFKIGGKKLKEDTKAYAVPDIAEKAKGVMLSTSDRVVLSAQFQKFIAEKFPDPSRYEDKSTAPLFI
jgi:hypothetical protein